MRSDNFKELNWILHLAGQLRKYSGKVCEGGERKTNDTLGYDTSVTLFVVEAKVRRFEA